MEKLTFDSGIKEFRVNGGACLRFNPGDPNVYERFVQAGQKVSVLEASLKEKAESTEPLALMAEADRQIKDILAWVFGGKNDFDAIFGGVSLLAVTGNGETVLANFLGAVRPILEDGAKRCAQQQVKTARQNRVRK